MWEFFCLLNFDNDLLTYIDELSFFRIAPGELYKRTTLPLSRPRKRQNWTVVGPISMWKLIVYLNKIIMLRTFCLRLSAFSSFSLSDIRCAIFRTCPVFARAAFRAGLSWSPTSTPAPCQIGLNRTRSSCSGSPGSAPCCPAPARRRPWRSEQRCKLANLQSVNGSSEWDSVGPPD